MKVYLSELSEIPKELHFSEADPWVSKTLAEIEENTPPPNEPCSIDLSLRKLQELVFIKGDLKLGLGLVCSRCAKDFTSPVRTHFEAMYTRDRALAPEDENVGVAHSEPTGGQAEDLEIEYLEKDYLELSDVLKEQVYLQIPLQPLCQEDCKGICPTCGQDQNTHPCQCHRVRNSALANALRNIKF